jgi:hypothetical protein
MVSQNWIALLVGQRRESQENLMQAARRPLHRALNGLVAGAQSIPLGDNSAEHRALAKAVEAARRTC